MSSIFKPAAVAALLVVSASASAWWGTGPWNSIGDAPTDGWSAGQGDFRLNFGVSTAARGRAASYGRGYGYDAAYFGVPKTAAYGHTAPAAIQTPTGEK